MDASEHQNWNRQILSLDKITDRSCGGKAFGLSQLIEMGLAVPAGFVIRNAKAQTYLADLNDFYLALESEQVAVRSSASDEDGDDASFAGQYDTILNVTNEFELRDAIEGCVKSAESNLVRSYQQERGRPAKTTMNVIVQCMVKAHVSGVVFTSDPITARRDRLLIDAVSGLGESLVSGEATPDHYEINLANDIVVRHLVDDTSLLNDKEILLISEQAKRAAATVGHPLDLEWAISEDGVLYWLQSRPITTLPSDLNEFDTVLPNPDDLLTTSNVSEMMPGAVCPLTISFTGGGIDYGLQHMQVKVGVRKIIDDNWQVTAAAFGHLFLNLTGNLLISAGVLGASADQAAQTLCGRIVPELKELPAKPLWVRLRNTFKLLKYCINAPSVVVQFTAELEKFVIVEKKNSAQMWDELASKIWFFNHCMAVHIQSSALSGFLCAIVENMVSSKANDSTVEEQAEAIRLLSGAKGIESVLMVEQLDKLIDKIASRSDAVVGFQRAEINDALVWLYSTKTLSEEFKRFLDLHGHRGVRELCMRDLSWRDNLDPLIQSMQAAVQARLVPNKNNKKNEDVAKLSQVSRGLQWILPRAHNAIRRRELTKSQLVELAYRFKVAFSQLGRLMVSDGLLPDDDLVKFFSVDELSSFIKNPCNEAIDHALARRSALDFQQNLSFPDISIGHPEPIDPESIVGSETDFIQGRPASRGTAEGFVRVAHNIEEAALLRPEEILITPITDIGWTPYFSLISGLVTDLGSSVSHGAVIAREYGLPCVVNTRCATRVCKTGDRVSIDGGLGTIALIP